MTRTSIPSLGLALLLALGASPAQAEVVIGYWVISATEGGQRTRCAAANTSDENGALLTAAVGRLGDIQFVMTRPKLAVTVGERLPAEFLIDGKSIALRDAKALGAGAVEFTGKVGGRGEGSLLRGLERGSTAVVQMAGLRSAFVLEGTDKAMAMLSRCAIDPSVVASPYLAERDLEAADDFPDEVEEAAGGTASSAGSASGSDGSPVDGLGRAMRNMTTDAAPVAQFQCEIDSDDLFGLRGLDNGKYEAPTTMMVTIAEDGRALINGSTLEPVKVDRGASLRSVGYSARDVMRATFGSVGTRAPLYGMTEKQGKAFQSVVNAFAGMGVDMIGENRFMVVGVTSGVVGFLDVEPDGSITNQRTPVCLRTQ